MVRDRWIGRWSELNAVLTVQLQAGSRFGVAILRSGAVLAVAVVLVAVSSLHRPKPVSLIQSDIRFPLASSVSSEYQRGLWAFRSPMTREVSPSPSMREEMGGTYPWLQLLAGGIYIFLIMRGRFSLLVIWRVNSSR